jgi:uncharacterized membrane protein
MQSTTLRSLSLQAIALLSLAGVLMSTYLFLVKIGLIGPLACGVSGGCDAVQASRWAVLLGVPVPAWGLLGYSALLVTSIVALRSANARVRAVLYLLALGAVLMSAYLTALGRS